MTEAGREGAIVARRVARPIVLDAVHPAPEWQSAEPISFCADWRGKNPDPALNTEVRLLWSPEMLYLRFVCRYREIFAFDDCDAKGRRDHLWDRDVAEAFVQPPDAQIHSSRSVRNPADRFYAFYKELEIAPNGSWIDLDISPAGGVDLRSGLSRSVYRDEIRKIWTAELALPIQSLTTDFDPTIPWRANFYRIEGRFEPRAYLAWQPTMTAQPDFHVPESFGVLNFQT